MMCLTDYHNIKLLSEDRWQQDGEETRGKNKEDARGMKRTTREQEHKKEVVKWKGGG